jgi:hypothetical protein
MADLTYKFTGVNTAQLANEVRILRQNSSTFRALEAAAVAAGYTTIEVLMGAGFFKDHVGGFMRNLARVIGQTKTLVGILAICLAVLGSGPCNAISERIDSFDLATSDKAAHWISLLGLGSDAGVRIKSRTVQLRDVTVSMTRIENATCIQDVCLTFFKYELGRVFEFIIPCKEGLVILDMATKDPNGDFVVDAVLAAGDNLTTLVRPTSLGPVITTVQDTRRP